MRWLQILIRAPPPPSFLPPRGFPWITGRDNIHMVGRINCCNGSSGSGVFHVLHWGGRGDTKTCYFWVVQLIMKNIESPCISHATAIGPVLGNEVSLYLSPLGKMSSVTKNIEVVLKFKSAHNGKFHWTLLNCSLLCSLFNAVERQSMCAS